jgi:lactoylglutathione lyase
MAFVKDPSGVSIELLQQGENLPINEKWASRESVGSW